VVGYPLSVSEWNDDPFPTQDRHVLPLYVAATASHQGWDALMQFAYTQEPTNRNSPSNWNSYNDPSLMATLPAAALLYRERHVAEATSIYVLALDAVVAVAASEWGGQVKGVVETADGVGAGRQLEQEI